jgi:hypothetical protein
LYWAASFLPVAGLAKIGSNSNYWTELAASTAVLAAAGGWAARRWRGLNGLAALLPAGALLGTLLAVVPALGPSVVPVFSVPQALRSHTAGLESVVERVRAEPGPVLADPMDVLALAGKEVLFEPYLFSLLYTQQRWDPEPLTRRICAGQIGLVVLDWPLETETGPTYQGHPFWATPIVEALRESMVLDSRQGGRFLYTPAPPSIPHPLPSTHCAGGA